MITREQVTAWLAENAANDWGTGMSTEDECDVLALALRCLDQEADAKLGAAVRAALAQSRVSHAELVKKNDPKQFRTGNPWASLVCSAVVAALRSESP